MTVVVPSYLVRQMVLTCEFQKQITSKHFFTGTPPRLSSSLLEYNYNENEVCLLKLVK